MCTEANVIVDGQIIECETVGQLAHALDLLPDAVSRDPAHCCLCNANWDALGARRATAAEGWPFPEYIIERSNAQGEPRS